MLVLMLVSVGAAIDSWRTVLRSRVDATATEPTFSEAEVEEAKKNVCNALKETIRIARINQTIEYREDEDEFNELAVALNHHQVYIFSRAYLIDVLRANPAAPIEIVRDTGLIIDNYLESLLDVLALQFDSKLGEARSIDRRLENFCKK